MHASTDTGSTSGSNVVILDEWRGQTAAKHWHNKDFAIAYDRLICIREGQYCVHAHTIRKSQAAHCRIVKNGTEIMTAHGGTDDHDPPNTSIKVFLNRGDWIQIKGAWFQSSAYSHFQITRL